MDKTQQKSDKSLADVYKLFEHDEKGQEMEFLHTVFDFLNRRSSFLAKPGISNKVIQMVHSHINTAKKNETLNQNLNQTKTSGITAKTAKSIPQPVPPPKKSEQVQPSKPAPIDESDHKMDVDVDVDDENEADKEAKPEGNGGRTDKYVWTQTLQEVELSMDIDANLRGKHLKIIVSKKHLFIAVKGKEATPIIDGDLHDSVNVDDSTWTLDTEYGKTTKMLTVVLAKMKGMNWWKRVLVGEPENSKFDSLDDETIERDDTMIEEYVKMSIDPQQNPIYPKLKEIVTKFGDMNGKTIVDVGSGPGIMLPMFDDVIGKNGKIYAIDIDKNFLSYCSNHIVPTLSNRDNIQLIRSKPNCLCLSDDLKGKIDVFVLAFVVNYLQEKERYKQIIPQLYEYLNVDGSGQVVVIDFDQEFVDMTFGSFDEKHQDIDNNDSDQNKTNQEAKEDPFEWQMHYLEPQQIEKLFNQFGFVLDGYILKDAVPHHHSLVFKKQINK